MCPQPQNGKRLHRRGGGNRSGVMARELDREYFLHEKLIYCQASSSGVDALGEGK